MFALPASGGDDNDSAGNADDNSATARPLDKTMMTTLQNRTDGGTWTASLTFGSPIISSKERHANFTLLIVDSKTGEPASHTSYRLMVSKLREGGGSDPRLIAQGESKNDGSGQFEMAFDKVGWYLIELSPSFNQTASFRVFSGGVDFETDRQAYFPGQTVRVSGITYPHDRVAVSLKTVAGNASALAATAAAETTASAATDENGAFRDIALSWPLNATAGVADGRYTITVRSQALGTQDEKTVYFSHNKPAIDIDVEPLPRVALAEKSDSVYCPGPSTRIFLNVKAAYSDRGQVIDNATVQLTGVYRMDEGNGDEPVPSFTIPEYESKFTYSEKEKTWFGPGYGYPPQGLFFYTGKSPSFAGNNYLLPGKYYFTVLVDDGQVKAVAKSKPFELTENVTRYLSAVGSSTGAISGAIKPGYNATFSGTSRYAGIAMDQPYQKGTVQYLMPAASKGRAGGTLNATGWLSLNWLEGATIGGYPIGGMLTSPFNVRIDPSTRLVGCSDSLYRTGLFYPLAIQNATSLRPGDSIAWASAPYANATVIGEERIKVMNATMETVRIREDTLPFESFEPQGRYEKYDLDAFGGPAANRIGLVDAWFEKGTGHLVKLSAQQMRYFSEEVGYRQMQVETVMNSTNMPMEKTYDYSVPDTTTGFIRKVFVQTNAVVDKFEYAYGNINIKDGNQPPLTLGFGTRPTLSDDFHYSFKIPKSIIGEQPGLFALARQQHDSNNTVAVPIAAFTGRTAAVDTSSDPYYTIIRIDVNGKDNAGAFENASLAGFEIRASGQAATTDIASGKERAGANYPLKELAFFSRTSDPEYYAQKLSDVLGLGRLLQLIDHRSEYDGTCGYSPQDVHSYYRFLVAGALAGSGYGDSNTTSTITVNMCAGEVVGVSYDAFDISVQLANGTRSILVPVSGIDNAPVVARPLSDYRTYINKTKEITLEYLDELPPLECFTSRGSCNNEDGPALDTVLPVFSLRLDQELPLDGRASLQNSTGYTSSAKANEDAGGARGRDVMEFIGNSVTASFDNTKGTLTGYSVSRMYDTSSAGKAIRYSPADARSIVQSYWNDELGISNVTASGGGMRADGTTPATICDGRIYYHIDSYQKDRDTSPLRFYSFENGVDAVTGEIVNDAQGLTINPRACPPADKFSGFTISARPDKQQYSKGEDVGIALGVANPANVTVLYERAIGGFIVFDSGTGKPVAGRAAAFVGGSTTDHIYRPGFIKFPAGQTTFLNDPSDNSPGHPSFVWENAQPGEYVVRVFMLSPFKDVTEFRIMIN